MSSTLRNLLTLCMTPGLGPVLIGRAIGALGSARAVLDAHPERLRTVPGIGPKTLRAIFDHRAQAERDADAQIARAAELGVTLVGIDQTDYPPLLRQTPDPPPVLYVRGSLCPPRASSDTTPPVQADSTAPTDVDPPPDYALGVVGSRACSQYGLEQADRFAAHLAGAGLTIVSGGARGIDTAAHRAALRAGGRTIVVLGCGLAHCYPSENAKLFQDIVEADTPGCIVSELPLDTAPAAENFPARNRIISGLSLGVLVIEAAKGSGALITAKLAAEDHGREVFALPGRVDAPASQGSLELLRQGGASMVIAPGDVLEELKGPARHLYHATHEARYTPPATPDHDLATIWPNAQSPAANDDAPMPGSAALQTLTDRQRAILGQLDTPRTIDQLAERVGLAPGELRAEVTLLELRRVIVREGSRFARVRNS